LPTIFMNNWSPFAAVRYPSSQIIWKVLRSNCPTTWVR
jgi:hypothetical protein